MVGRILFDLREKRENVTATIPENGSAPIEELCHVAGHSSHIEDEADMVGNR